jgi:hypothetical protein
MLAIENGQPENARLLIEKGADASLKSSNGATALSLARKKGYYEITRLLGGDEVVPGGDEGDAAIPKRLTYSAVVATYPPGATRCGTMIDVISVTPTGGWETLGIVDYRSHVPQLQCLGTRVTFKVPADAGGVRYEAGTKLTVDKDLRWVVVESWD